MAGPRHHGYLLHVIEHGVTEFAMASAILDELGHEVGDLAILTLLDSAQPQQADPPRS